MNLNCTFLTHKWILWTRRGSFWHEIEPFELELVIASEIFYFSKESNFCRNNSFFNESAFFWENDRLHTDPKMDGKTFWTENHIAMVWNRFEQVRTKILTFKFELKSHFIIIQNLKMLKYLQLRRLEFARSGSLFFQNNKIYQNSDFKNWSSKFSEISISKISKITILDFDSSANQVQYCSLGWNHIW